MNIGVAILTRNAEATIERLLVGVCKEPCSNRVVVFDTSSTDRTRDIVQKFGVEFVSIAQEDFNHGHTREFARKYLKTKVIIFLTQDVFLESEDCIQTLVEPILRGVAAVSYARQIPRDGAGFFEAFPRHFNYSGTSEIRGKKDLPDLGSFTYFCSNSCAAWDNEVLDKIGGFPATLTNEDTYAAAGIVRIGYAVAYVAEAVVKHSHNYTLWEEFCRYFDTGYVRGKYGKEMLMGQRDEKHGVRFICEMFRQLLHRRPILIPYGFANIFVKYVGYKVGVHGGCLPICVKEAISGQKYFWRSKFYRNSTYDGK